MLLCEIQNPKTPKPQTDSAMHSRRPSKPGSVRRHRKKSKVVAPDAGIDDPVLMNVYREFDAELVPKEKVKYEAEMRRLVEKFAKRKVCMCVHT